MVRDVKGSTAFKIINVALTDVINVTNDVDLQENTSRTSGHNFVHGAYLNKQNMASYRSAPSWLLHVY